VYRNLLLTSKYCFQFSVYGLRFTVYGLRFGELSQVSSLSEKQHGENPSLKRLNPKNTRFLFREHLMCNQCELLLRLVELQPMRKLKMEELNRKSIDEFRRSDKIPVIAVLENVRSAYNVGSVFRTADAFLLDAIFICGYTAKPPHKEIRKTALGADETVEWKHFGSAAPAIETLKQQGYKVYAVEQTVNSVSLQSFGIDKPGKIAVVFGNEVTGVEQSTIQLCDGTIEIPQLGMKHSLNISVAAGIVLWELTKQYFKNE
jgi:23S rRNA (guanosine2251-2'-O)-methyltransferase